MFNAQNLYNDLLELCRPEDSPFYFVDHKLDDNLYRVFTYRLAQYTDFLKPNALECRSSMFEVKEDGSFIRLASLGMEKFFNIGEVEGHINTPEALFGRAKGAFENGELSKDIF